jgi:hypothetical protein
VEKPQAGTGRTRHDGVVHQAADVWAQGCVEGARRVAVSDHKQALGAQVPVQGGHRGGADAAGRQGHGDNVHVRGGHQRRAGGRAVQGGRAGGRRAAQEAPAEHRKEEDDQHVGLRERGVQGREQRTARPQEGAG